MNIKKYIVLALVFFSFFAYGSESNRQRILAKEFPGNTADDFIVTADERECAQELRSWFLHGGYKKHVEKEGNNFKIKNPRVVIGKSERVYTLSSSNFANNDVPQPTVCSTKRSNCTHEDTRVVLREEDSIHHWIIGGPVGLKKSGEQVTPCELVGDTLYKDWYIKKGLPNPSEQEKLYDNEEGDIIHRGGVRPQDWHTFYTNNSFFSRFFYTKKKESLFFYQKRFTNGKIPILAPLVAKEKTITVKDSETVIPRIAPLVVCATVLVWLTHCLRNPAPK
jgi:hypothetical protein